MKEFKAKAAETPSPPLIVLMGFGILICFTSLLMALAICIDRADELFNGLRYQGNWHMSGVLYRNTWEPFKNCGVWNCFMEIPHDYYMAFRYFPTAFFIGILFSPLLLFATPLYDAVYGNDYTMLVKAWLPFAVGAGTFMAAGMLIERSRGGGG